MHPGTGIEALTREGPEQIVAAFGVRSAYPCNALEVVSSCRDPQADLPESFEAVHEVDCGVLLISVVTKTGDVPFEDGMEFVAVVTDMRLRRRRARASCVADISYYGVNNFVASGRVCTSDRHITWRIHQTSSRSFTNSCRFQQLEWCAPTQMADQPSRVREAWG